MPYRELRPPADLVAAVACVWEHRAGPGAHLVVPDGCVDLMWLAGRELVVAGPDTEPREIALPVGSLTTGVRLRPGAAGSFLGMPASEIRDGQPDAAELWGAADADRLIDRLAGADASGRRDLLVDAVRRTRPVADPLVAAAAHHLLVGSPSVSELARSLGAGERMLHRRTVQAVGYPPKTLARVLRLRRLAATVGPLADRALAAGYASQSHMSDEVRRLTGRSAVRFLEADPAPAA